MNKKLLLASLLTATIASSASAGHYGNDNQYTGFNFGVQGGISFNDVDATGSVGALSAKSDLDHTAGTIGGFIGYGFQTDHNLYLGLEVEAGFQFGDESKNITASGTTFKGEIDPKYNVGLNGQIGYVFDHGLLGYVFGGVNFQKYETKLTNTTTTASAKDNKLHTGFKIGAGARYLFQENLFGDLKYDYNHFNNNSVTIAGTTQRLKVEPCQHNVRIGLGMVV